MTSHHGKTESVIEELKSVLYPGVTEIVVVNDPEILKTGEYFVFLSSKNFLKKKDDIVKLSSVLRVESRGETPYRFSDKEVSGFVKSIEKQDQSVPLKKGDVVVVREGYLKNLFGLVCGNKGGKVKVLFKFHVRKFHELLDSKILKREKSIFDAMPSNVDKKIP